MAWKTHGSPPGRPLSMRGCPPPVAWVEPVLSATVEQALASALEQARRGDRVLVFGSFHTVAEALPLLQ